ncbi:DUF2254 family protein [Streptomyces sp. Ncost-T10-10d]|uniref:DUF2254 family protein n=1 Tax=Streptomyces sp. Ncost-T10-10d TaxID=1839774 RepID=UPI000B89F483|nr:DUF2254 family protein [Streptomyces sp. Ncost-T10-10d]
MRSFHLEAQWRRKAARTNLWLVPTIEVAVAVGLFAVTYALDRAANNGRITPPSWAISGTADAARQILTTLAAAVITVVGVVFSIVIVTLALASTRFGPRIRSGSTAGARRTTPSQRRTTPATAPHEGGALVIEPLSPELSE